MKVKLPGRVQGGAGRARNAAAEDSGTFQLLKKAVEPQRRPSLDLGRMYNLVSRITDGLGELKKLLETHIHNQGLAAIEKCGEAALNVGAALGSDSHPPHQLTHAVSLQDPKVYVQTTLDVHKKYNALVMSAFNNDAGFVAALDKVSAPPPPELGASDRPVVTPVLLSAGVRALHQQQRRHQDGPVLQQVPRAAGQIL